MQLTSYAITLSQRFILSGFDDYKVQSLFKKFPVRHGHMQFAHLPLNDEQLDKYLEVVEEDLRQKILEALNSTNTPYTTESIDNLLKLVKQSDLIPSVTESQTELFQLASLLVEKARVMTITISENAEKEFRKHPLSQNFFRWMATWKMIDVVGADMPASFAPPFTFLYNKPYTVISGDTLSKIALKYYGYANLWDIIWKASGMNFHPDLIIPGQKLTMP